MTPVRSHYHPVIEQPRQPVLLLFVDDGASCDSPIDWFADVARLSYSIGIHYYTIIFAITY